MNFILLLILVAHEALGLDIDPDLQENILKVALIKYYYNTILSSMGLLLGLYITITHTAVSFTFIREVTSYQKLTEIYRTWR